MSLVTAQKPILEVTWEKLPKEYILPDDPVENILQPFLAAALTESLDLAGLVVPQLLLATNMGICAKVGKKTVVKAPDWFYATNVVPSTSDEIRRSYTPHAEGDVPLLVMEFLSETDAGEYSVRPTYPYGKLWFYERILQAPFYIIFDPSDALLEVRHLQSQEYERLEPNDQGKYWIEELRLFLGVWRGNRQGMTANWLRWWDTDGNLLLWGSEKIDQERQRAEQQRQRADRLASKLKELGIELSEE